MSTFFDLPPTYGRKEKYKSKLKSGRSLTARPGNLNPVGGEFRCLNCRSHVTADPLFSGVLNRNHCPYCLWSKHVDLWQAGDRLAACKEKMRPVALTIKQTRKKYNFSDGGELMLVHLCQECLKISINRVAADDDPDTVMRIFHDSLQLDPWMDWVISNSGVQALQASDAGRVQARLHGWDF